MARFTQDESPIVKKAAAEGITVDEYIAVSYTHLTLPTILLV